MGKRLGLEMKETFKDLKGRESELCWFLKSSLAEKDTFVGKGLEHSMEAK